MSRKPKTDAPPDAKVHVSASAKSRNSLNEWINEHRLKPQQVSVVSAMIEWFLRQEDIVQTAVLSNVDRGMESAYIVALRALIADVEAGKANRMGVHPMKLVAMDPNRRGEK